MIIFHVWLASKGITTFEYIAFRRQDAENKRDVKNGYMTERDYKEWRSTALVDPARPKSKTITRKIMNVEEQEKIGK